MAMTDQELLNILQTEHILTIEVPFNGYVIDRIKIDPETLKPVNGGKIIIHQQSSFRFNNRKYYFVSFFTNSLNAIKFNPFNGCIREVLFNAIEEGILTEEIPENIAGVEAETDISTPVPRIMNQLFRIVSVVENEDYVTVTARHVWYDNLKNYTLWEPAADTDYTAADACRAILDNAMSPSVSHVECNCTDTKKGSEFDYKRKNLVEAFLDPENGICAKFNLALLRYNWDFYCVADTEYNRGFVVEDGKNLLGVERKESIENVATRIVPYGQDESGNIVWLNNNGLKYVDSPYIDDYSCPQVEMFDTRLRIGENDVTSGNINGKLLAAGQARFSADHVDVPDVEMKVQFISLGDTEEYAQYRNLDKVYLYDTITIRDSVRGYNYTAQVVGVTHDILTGMLLNVTIGKLDNWNGTRKVATWQIPEVNGSNIRLSSIRAGSFKEGAVNGNDVALAAIGYDHLTSTAKGTITTYALQAAKASIHELIAGSITADDITAGSITTVTLAANAVTADKIDAGAVTAEKISAGAIGAEKIVAGAITTEKLDAYAVTAAKIESGAVTAEKIASGAITANHIDTDDITAINATLGTADIADARIGLADISYAKVKDLNAQSAYFGQAVIQEGLANKLYIPRLAANYAQIVNATISDLVIQATNDNFYKLDVDLSGNVTATQITPSSQEISDGHTSDGRTIYMGTDIVASDLNTMNIYASHALMDEITANILNVDKLFAREATIGKINALDLSSNTYIQSTIGNWQSGSTITQTINGLDSRISSLGYGTVYMQPNEPDHSELVSGDIWIQTMTEGSWQEIYDTYDTWNEIYQGDSTKTPPVAAVSSWQVLGSIPIMWVWDGQRFQLMYDALLPTTLETEIEQLATAISLRATQAEVDLLGEDVAEFNAQLVIQAQEIEAAVSAVNAKAASYVMWADPRTAYTVSLGDIWIKRDLEGFNNTSTWQTVYNEFATWNALYSMHDSWGDMLGDRTYVWNGTTWVETSDRAAEIYQKTLIDESATSISLIAQTTATMQNDLIALNTSLTVANDHISAEVTRATTAENGKIDKTSQYQSADAIVGAVQSWVGTSLANESYIEQTATGIGAYVADHAYTIKSGIAIKAAGIEISGAKYIKIKSGGYFAVDSGNFSINTSGDVSVTGSITATYITANDGGSIGGWSISAHRLSSGSGSGYVALDSTANGTYAIWAGNSSPGSAKFWVKRDGSAYFEGQIKAAANSVLGGWTLGSNDLHSGSGSNYVAMASSGTYALWAGAENAASAKFWLKRNGEAYFEGKIKAAADSTMGGWTLSANSLYSGSGSNYVALASSGTYAIWAGAESAGSAPFRVQRNGQAYFGGWSLASDRFYAGSGNSYVALASSGDVAVWAGASSADSAPFRVKTDGTVYLTKLITIGESGSETEINLRTANLWKLDYSTVKSSSSSGGYCDSITLTNGTTLNFNNAALVILTGSWSGNTFTVTNNMNDRTSAATIEFEHDTASWYDARMAIAEDHKVTMNIVDPDRNLTPLTMELDGTLTYTAGYTQGKSDVYVTSASIASSGGYLDTWTATISLSSGNSQTVALANTYTPLKALYDSGHSDGYSDGKSDEWSSVYGQCYSTRDGAVISTKIPSTSLDSYSTYSYTISTDYSWENPAHIKIIARINGIEVSSQSVRANQPVT